MRERASWKQGDGGVDENARQDAWMVEVAREWQQAAVGVSRVCWMVASKEGQVSKTWRGRQTVASEGQDVGRTWQRWQTVAA
jgi:hypothetical protein